LLLGVAAISLAACGGGDATATPAAVPTATAGATGEATATSSTGGTGSGEESAVAATLNEWSINLNVDQVKAGQVKFVVINAGQFQHDMVIMDSAGNQMGATPVFKKEEGPKELVVDLKPGTYTVVCDVPGHTSQGMKLDLSVK
jgi:uncharacterized cupredoxin-like copper-binding protein